MFYRYGRIESKLESCSTTETYFEKNALWWIYGFVELIGFLEYVWKLERIGFIWHQVFWNSEGFSQSMLFITISRIFWTFAQIYALLRSLGKYWLKNIEKPKFLAAKVYPCTPIYRSPWFIPAKVYPRQSLSPPKFIPTSVCTCQIFTFFIHLTQYRSVTSKSPENFVKDICGRYQCWTYATRDTKSVTDFSCKKKGVKPDTF